MARFSICRLSASVLAFLLSPLRLGLTLVTLPMSRLEISESPLLTARLTQVVGGLALHTSWAITWPEMLTNRNQE